MRVQKITRKLTVIVEKGDGDFITCQPPRQSVGRNGNNQFWWIMLLLYGELQGSNSILL